jgi:hypothetical protein
MARAGVGFSLNSGGGSTSTLVLSRCGVSYSLLEQTIDPGKKRKNKKNILNLNERPQLSLVNIKGCTLYSRGYTAN